jgi:1,4-alpha-glucan branching enzyme
MATQRFVRFLLAFCLFAALPAGAAAPRVADPYQPVPYVSVKHPDWSRNATIYELNTRQFTAEGTFRAAEKQLPRLKELGIDIVWLMPIHPIGVKNRKGELGSPYSVRDFYGVNPEFGTVDDLKHFVATAHGLGLHVILDWVGNHTAWDNALVTQHPDWYAHDWKGEMHPTPWWDWTDIIDLDYSKPGLRRYMTGAMKYWVKDVGVDGFRCDAAGFVPLDFWDNARRELDAIKPVFMLGEWEARDLHAHAFDMTYAWSWYDAVQNIAKGKADLNALFVYYSWNEKYFPDNSMRMTHVTNHDKNSWDGTEFETFGPALDATIVLSVVGAGMPLMYNGQEAGNTKRLKFFERDPIEWRPSPYGGLYQKLFALKHANTALWNANWGAQMIKVPNNVPEKVLSFVRQNDKDKVFAVMNFSGQPQSVKFDEALFPGTYTDYFEGKSVELTAATQLELPPWSYHVYVRSR